MEKISVIMSVYNEQVDWLNLSIESILNQSYKNFEFIIILDNPKEIELEKLILNYKKLDSRIIFIKNDKNRGLVYSLNRALKIATGQYIARMDADDISEIKRLEIQLDNIKRNNSDLVACKIQYIDEEDNIIGVSSCYGQTAEKCRKSLKFDNILPHPTWLAKKELFDELCGYIDVPTIEDYILLCRAQIIGKRMFCINEVLLKYRIRSSGICISKSSFQSEIGLIAQKEYRRTLKNCDEFNISKIINSLSKMENEVNLYNKSLLLYKEGVNAFKNRKLFKTCILIIISVIISPKQLKILYNKLSLKIINYI